MSVREHYIINRRHIGLGPKSKYRFVLYYFKIIQDIQSNYGDTSQEKLFREKAIHPICKHFKRMFWVFRAYTDQQVWELILKSYTAWWNHLHRDYMNKIITDFESIVNYK